MENQEKEKLIEEMKTLTEKINKASYEYYVLDNPTISDKEWDAMYYRLLDIEKETGIVLENSPSQKVGGETLAKFQKVTHEHKLYSLAKAQTIEEIVDWNTRNQNIFPFDEEYSVEYKFDGLSLSLSYDNGNLIKASTRGNGEIGEDVTAQVKTIRTVPLKINFKGRIDIQGEGIIKLSELDKYNQTATEKLKNARNAVAGAIRNLDPKVTAKRNLDFFAYNINYSPNKEFSSQEEICHFLKNEGFLVGNFFKITHSIDEITKLIEKVNNSRHSLNFLIDGMVIKINKTNIREQLGFTEKTPRWAIAYKFEAEETSTILNDVTWQRPLQNLNQQNFVE
jgi:DNA ligase (NAD+)